MFWLQTDTWRGNPASYCSCLQELEKITAEQVIESVTQTQTKKKALNKTMYRMECGWSTDHQEFMNDPLAYLLLP